MSHNGASLGLFLFGYVLRDTLFAQGLIANIEKNWLGEVFFAQTFCYLALADGRLLRPSLLICLRRRLKSLRAILILREFIRRFLDVYFLRVKWLSTALLFLSESTLRHQALHKLSGITFKVSTHYLGQNLPKNSF